MSEVRLKEKYAIGSNQKPTLEECISCPECEKHFHESIKKIAKYFTKEEIYDLKIDSYIYAIRKFNGKSNFLTFLYLVARQHAMKLYKKNHNNYSRKIKSIESFKNLVSYEDKRSLISNNLPESLQNIAIDKFVNSMTLAGISQKYKLSMNETNKTIKKIKEFFVE